ncbi:MAG: DUF4298 domain-containing protein [Firmicutes bacterium]|nr:DUF4298 domain-containing protein [Bacillota bacterium]
MDQIDRIKHFEEILDRANEVHSKLEAALDDYAALMPLIAELEEYYSGEEWISDFEDDEAGKLPADLKRGVLSEDAVYDALTSDHELLINMLETVTKALRS